jgi:hypothetical protein
MARRAISAHYRRDSVMKLPTATNLGWHRYELARSAAETTMPSFTVTVVGVSIRVRQDQRPRRSFYCSPLSSLFSSDTSMIAGAKVAYQWYTQ